MNGEHYQRALHYLAQADWPAAEGALLQLRLAAGEQDPALADALAYALLMQGDHHGCLAALEPVLDHPQRSFWIHHKAGDAQRGLHNLPAAERHYRQALADGSTSALTVRNLLQVLHACHPDQALAALTAWGPEPEPWCLEGMREAAELVAGLELAAWLASRGWASAVLERRLMEQRLYGLEPLAGLGGAGAPGAEAEPEPEPEPAALWCHALRQRLQDLGISPGG